MKVPVPSKNIWGYSEGLLKSEQINSPSILICDLLLKQIIATADLPTLVGTASATDRHRWP